MDLEPNALDMALDLYRVGRDKHGRARGRVLITKKEMRRLMEMPISEAK